MQETAGPMSSSVVKAGSAPIEIPAPPDFSHGPLDALERSVILRFEEMVGEHADRPAATHRGQTLTYRALNRAANALAREILQEPGSPDSPVMLMFEDGLLGVVGLLGALKSARIYVAVDPSNPVARLQVMLKDSGADCLVTVHALDPLVKQLSRGAQPLRVIYADDLDAAGDVANPELYPPLDSTACINYTSGSTGEPKGLVHSHRSYIYFQLLQHRALQVAPSDRFSLMLNPGVGMARPVILGALLAGGTVCLFDLPAEGPRRALDWMASERITVLRVTPSVLRTLFGAAPPGLVLPSLRCIWLNGEATRASDVALFRRHTPPECRLRLSLGSGEGGSLTALVLDHETDLPGDVLPVGYPLPDKEITLVDENGEPVAAGQVGEIIVRSEDLAMGYWRQPELTAQKFRPDPSDAGKRILLTGDLGRWRPDGMLEFVGRQDAMVKVRGQRVDLSEVERAVLSDARVLDAAVVARPSRIHPDQIQLAAYAVLRPGAAAAAADLRRHLSARLPEYMIPAHIIFLDKIPLSRAGKVDRRALPEPPEREEPSAQDLPADEIETRLAEIWTSTLKTGTIGVKDDFFELGGDSLSVLAMMVEVEQAFGKRVPRSFFGWPTIRGLADLLRRPEAEPLERSFDFPAEAPRRTSRVIAEATRRPGRAMLGRLRGQAKQFRREINQVDLLAWFVRRATRDLDVDHALAFVHRLAARRGLAALVFRSQQRMFERFLLSVGVPAGHAAQRFRNNIVANLWKVLLQQGHLFGAHKESTFIRALQQMLESAPVSELDMHFPVDGLHHLEGAFAAGRGVVLVCLHGASEGPFVTRLLSRRLGGEPIQTLSHRLAYEASAFRDYRHLLPSALAGSMYAELAYYAQLLLEAGKIVRLFSDHLGPGPGDPYEFNVGDRLYQMKPGFAELALNTGAAVIPTFGRVDAQGRLHLVLRPPLDPGTGDHREQLRWLSDQFAAFMNYVVATYPETLQWEMMKNHLRRKRVRASASTTSSLVQENES